MTADGCLHCHAPLDSPRRFYCSNACRQRAYRRRKIGWSADTYEGMSGLRGSARLGVEPRYVERQWEREQLLTLRARGRLRATF